MQVRPVTEADLPELARGFKSVADEGRWIAADPSVTEAELEARLRDRLGGEGTLLVLEDRDEAGDPVLTGHVDLRPTRTEGVWSFGLLVLGAHRGRGGGKRLLEAAIEARPRHVHKIELEVWPDNEPAIGLYESLGFEREGLRRDHYRRRDGRLRSSLIMARLFAD